MSFNSSNSSIGNNRKVVTEHCTADNGTGADSHREAGFIADARCNRSKRGNCAYGSTHRNGNEAADGKEACNRHVARQNGKAEVNGAFYTAGSADSAGKGTCGEEDEAHGENVFVTYAGRSKAQLLYKAELLVLQEGYD